jgi:parvulin-like peptidyl-prolyl isomerase
MKNSATDSVGQPIAHGSGRLFGGFLLAVASLSFITTTGCGKKDKVIRPTDKPALADRRTNSTDDARRGDSDPGGVLDRNVNSNAAAATNGSQLVTRRPAPTVPSVPAAAPTTAPVLQDASFVWLGAVIGEVNGTPLYAHDLLRKIEPVLKAKAKELDKDRFKEIATREIVTRRQLMIRDELFFASANRNTSASEKEQAEQMAFIDGQRFITQAGGSVQRAREMAKEQGMNYDTLKDELYRNRLVGIYFNKRLQPRARVSVDEMRRYYSQNREKEFTAAAEVKFNVIRVDFSDTGGEAAAKQRAEEARAKLLSGSDFKLVSDEFNKDARLRERNGLVGPIKRGSYRVTEIEDAVWGTDVGSTTNVIVAGASAWVAQVSEKKAGSEQSFDDPEVQKMIESQLRQKKLSEIESLQSAQLERDSVIDRRDELLAPAIAMAMQMYSSWRAE